MTGEMSLGKFHSFPAWRDQILLIGKGEEGGAGGGINLAVIVMIIENFLLQP